MSDLAQFKNFPKEWNVMTFLDAIKDVTGGNTKIKQSDACKTGIYPVIDQGQQACCGYVDDDNALCKEELPTVLFGDHTKIIKLIDYPFVLGADGVKVLSPKVPMDKKFLFHFLKTIKLPVNAGYSRHYKFLKEAVIPVPPLAEQIRIAAILDKADSLRRKNQQAIQLADQFLRAVFLDMFGDPVTNPKGWEVKKLKEISHIQIGPFGTQLHKEDYIEGGIPLINPTHIVNGKIVSNMNYTIPSNKHAELDEYHLKAGDIIMGRRGEMGRCAVVTEQENGWLCGTGSLFIRTHNAEIFAEYLCTLLSGKTIKSYLEAESQGATMSNLNKTIVGNINIPVPSENALKKYSIIQENTMKNINKMGCFSGELLFNSLSQKAFAGEL
jgi:type I restriction enzyme S subunit